MSVTTIIDKLLISQVTSNVMSTEHSLNTSL